MRWAWGFAVALLAAACSASSQPATTPATVFDPPTTTTTPTTLATTTTADRLTEIEAILQDLEQRRIDALYRGDRDAYRALFANDGYLEASMVVFEELEFESTPVVDVEVRGLLHDGSECMAVERVLHRSDLGASSDPGVEVLELHDGVWLISFVGSGWTCDGPHPFDS